MDSGPASPHNRATDQLDPPGALPFTAPEESATFCGPQSATAWEERRPGRDGRQEDAPARQNAGEWVCNRGVGGAARSANHGDVAAGDDGPRQAVTADRGTVALPVQSSKERATSSRRPELRTSHNVKSRCRRWSGRGGGEQNPSGVPGRKAIRVVAPSPRRPEASGEALGPNSGKTVGAALTEGVG
ncbi:hypothetical protein THAOC_08374, partial [Thalassiosira oceanica]